MATLSAEQGNFQEAIEVFEATARAYVDNHLLKYSAKGLLLNAGICHLAGTCCNYWTVIAQATASCSAVDHLTLTLLCCGPSRHQGTCQ